jgi:hypothetical protein
MRPHVEWTVVVAWIAACVALFLLIYTGHVLQMVDSVLKSL